MYRIKFACNKYGNNCNYVAYGKDMGEIIQKIKKHEREAHQQDKKQGYY